MEIISDANKKILQQYFETLPQKEKSHSSRTSIYLRITAENLRAVPALGAECSNIAPQRLPVYAMEYGLYHNIGKAFAAEGDELEHVRDLREKLTGVLLRGHICDAFYLSGLIECAQYHHSRWDGSGYPEGLKGKDIPFWGRMCAAAAEYDYLALEMRSSSQKKLMERFDGMSGSELDPDIVQIYDKCQTMLILLKNTQSC